MYFVTQSTFNPFRSHMETNVETLSPPEITDHPEKNKSALPHYLGYLLLAVSFFLYVLVEFINASVQRGLFTVFILHYLLAIAYAAILIYHKAYGIRKSWRKANIRYTIILLNLFLVSAYALNREIPVFEKSTDWLCVYLMLTSLAVLSYEYFRSLPRWVNKLQHLLLGSAFILYLYLALYVANVYVFGTIGILLLGIGAHVFVPIVLIIGCISLLIHNRNESTVSFYWVIAGVLITIGIATGFAYEWNNRVAKIEKLANHSVLYPDAELPVWIKVGQSLPNDWITERILKSDLVYTTARDKFDEWNFRGRNVSWDEPKRHDPFVVVSTLLSECSLSGEDRVKIVQAISDNRHRGQERLWSGDNLTTSYIVSDIDIYTDLRLAYTEKYLNVKNNAVKDRWWGNTEEAIYTFQLPEGSVVTSLSLWIEGKEEKGILASKQKATNAYKTIVGVERKDPSVVHWQEGNTITVRIFPCTSSEERKFKIGVTSPLLEDEGKIYYKNITFLGPNPIDARETTRVRFLGSPEDVLLPSDFLKDKKGNLIAEHPYDPEFEISFKAGPLKPNRFSFNGATYSLTPYTPEFKSLQVKNVYLDINNVWTQHELEEIKSLTGNYNLFIYADDEFVKISSENQYLLNEAQQTNFSLFPFYKINDPEHALVITKGKPVSPHLNDFKDSKFGESLKDFFAAGQKVNVYNLKGRASAYVSSLREFRGLEFAQGDIGTITNWLADQKFPKTVESDDQVVLHDSKMLLTKVESLGVDSSGNAPDHLARLFAYNNIMRKVGSSYFRNDFINAALVEEAASAYVVSPVSSLIVLESQEDYKRFGITDTDNSLKNAAKQSSGAVPEPHEWALIILFVFFVLAIMIRSYKRKYSL
jgi:XrtN system VIT domain protein